MASGLADHHGASTIASDIFAATQARTVQWRKDSSRSARLEVQHCLEDLRRDRAVLQDLQVHCAGAGQLTQAAKKAQAESIKLLEVMRESASAVAQRAEVVTTARDKLQRTHSEREEELQRERRELAQRRKTAKVQEAEIDSFFRLYKERLGLVVSRTAPRTVRLVFTLLDENDPAREFSLTLSIESHREYRILECIPPVAEADSFLEQLNCCNGLPTGLPAFVCNMRHAFKRVAACAP
mmetsp:Transcript_4472/g.10496  ORF Transcript_4472/g.10496 Transcript_4472/m.10496 type:complete len:239 (-) Transcript_4472:76-792(-)